MKFRRNWKLINSDDLFVLWEDFSINIKMLWWMKINRSGYWRKYNVLFDLKRPFKRNFMDEGSKKLKIGELWYLFVPKKNFFLYKYYETLMNKDLGKMKTWTAFNELFVLRTKLPIKWRFGETENFFWSLERVILI